MEDLSEDISKWKIIPKKNVDYNKFDAEEKKIISECFFSNKNLEKNFE